MPGQKVHAATGHELLRQSEDAINSVEALHTSPAVSAATQEKPSTKMHDLMEKLSQCLKMRIKSGEDAKNIESKENELLNQDRDMMKNWLQPTKDALEKDKGLFVQLSKKLQEARESGRKDKVYRLMGQIKDLRQRDFQKEDDIDKKRYSMITEMKGFKAKIQKALANHAAVKMK